ncbi:EamA family transporter [Candidatus Dojkabacteria bacterium]|uniref:EamA family transporter n=1 Tax=Candidatus Dojkabacteria bacterium TaxID=2099670 RepID=A0A955I512_9BACT|nr:EamA family transporter [Candidatus Dojkabacteria bacterium]
MLKQFKGSFFLIIAAAAFATYGVFAKYLSGYDVFFQGYVRSLIVAGVLFVLGLVFGQLRPIKRADLKYWFIILLATTFVLAPLTYAYRNLPLGTASFLFYSTLTVATYFLGRAFFNEKLTKAKIISAALALVGLFTIFSVDFSSLLLLPMLMAALNGVASSGELVSSKNLTDKYSSLQVTMVVFLWIGVSNSVFSLLTGESQNLALITVHWPYLLGICTASIIGVIFVYAGFKNIDPSVGALIGLLEIIFSVIFGAVLFGEILSINTLIGGGLILIAAALPNAIELAKRNPTTRR